MFLLIEGHKAQADFR